ncbi:MAG: hypothetical protein K2P51_00150 [Rhabdochlamydiaceae bacterium]|nr:hypothetical protein [Rhabdochlamydiaceae bacterium]
MAAISNFSDFVRVSEQALRSSQRQRLILNDAGKLVTAETSRYFRPNGKAIEENRRVWSFFLDCLKSTLGEQKLQRIAARYQINFHEIQGKGSPLLPQLVEKISIGATRTLSTDLKADKTQRLKKMSTEQINNLFAQKTCPIVGDPMNPFYVYGGPTQKRAWLIHNPQLMDKELHFLSTQIDKISFSAWRERLCKTMINKELMEKQILPAPGANGRVEYYKVYRRISGNGLVAYALKPVGADSTLQPLVVFRPTQIALSYEDMIDSLMNDLELRIGQMGYVPARPKFDALMKDPHFCPPGKKVTVAGYSLGGTHAQWFTYDHWKRISKSCFYNAPSVHEEMAEDFAKQVNGAPFAHLKIRIKRVVAGLQGDWAHFLGGKHLGWGIKRKNMVKLTEYNCVSRTISSLFDRIWLHTRRVVDSDKGHFVPTVVDPKFLDEHLDNESRGPAIYWYEKMRRVWGGTLILALSGLKSFANCIYKWTGLSLIRSSKP